MPDTSLWIENYIKILCTFSAQGKGLKSSPCSHRPVRILLPGQSCLIAPPCNEWDGTKRILLASRDALIYFHSHTKPERTQPCTRFVPILCYEYRLLLLRVNKIYAFYKSWKIISLSSTSTFLACFRAGWLTVSNSYPQDLCIYRTS